MTNIELIKQELTPAQIVKIERFCDDAKLFDAVKKVLLSSIYSHGVIKAGLEHNPLQNGAFSLASLALTNPIPDAEIGAHVRAMFAGVNALENGFVVLQGIKQTKEKAVESPYNEAE